MSDMYDDEETGRGITLGEIFRTIFSQKWLALILAVVITVVGVLGIHLVYTKERKMYTMSFVFTSLSSSNISSLYSYADGTTFYSSSFVTEETLRDVRDSKPEYASIDVDKIIEKNAVAWSEEVKALGDEDSKKDDKDKDLPVYIVHNISFSVGKKYFKDVKQAKAFLTDVLYYPTNKYATIDLNYNIYLNKYNFDNTLTFGEQLDALQSQMGVISSLYNALPDIANEDGTLVASYRHDYNAWLARQDIGALRTEASANYYLKNWKRNVDIYLNNIVSLRHSLEDTKIKYAKAQEVYSQMLNPPPGSTVIADGSIASTVNSYQSTITDIERQLANYYNYIASYYKVTNYKIANPTPMDNLGNPYDFSNELQFELDAQGNKIEIAEHIAATEVYGAKIQEIYDELMNGNEHTGNISYLDKVKTYSKEINPINAKKLILSPVVEAKGGLNILLEGAISLVAGLVVACIAAFAVGRSKQNKQKLAAANGGVCANEGAVGGADAENNAAKAGEAAAVDGAPEAKS